MRRGGAHAPIFNRKIRYGSVNPGAQTGTSLTPSNFCGWDGGSPTVQGSDSWDGGSPSTVGSDTIDFNVAC